MIINFKYHIASLAAVFVSLGLGILIGSSLLGNDALIKQQEHMTARLETQIESLRSRNDSLASQVAALETERDIQKQYEKKILPALTGGMLENRSVAIIQTVDYGYPEELANSIEYSGATIHSVTTVNSGLNIKGKEGIVARLNWQAVEKSMLVPRMAGEIASAVITGDMGVIGVLADEGMIKVYGDYGSPVTDVIIIGGSPVENLENIKEVDYPIIDYFTSQKINVIGAEYSFAEVSYMKQYQKKGITTVDNIDDIPGLYSVIHALSGKPGHYGVKATSRKLIPEATEGIAGLDG